MSSFVFFAVLAAAVMHVAWNAMVKIGLDRLLTIALVTTGAGIAALPLLPVVPPPAMASWPWLVTSVALHIGYNLALARAYDLGDFSLVYPIARGSAPLLTALIGALFLGEILSLTQVSSVLVLVVGVWTISLQSRGGGRITGSAILPALVTSLWISGYSISDGVGARASGSPVGYALWLFVVDGAVMLALMLYWRGRSGVVEALPYWRSGLVGGALSLGAYGIVIWAMTEAPIALVAALRESSVLFAVLISITILREPVRLSRGLGVVLVAAGVMLLKLA